MIVKGTTSVAFVVALAVGTAAMLDAQGRRGGGPAGGARTGTVEHITVHGKALEGNLEADSPDREVTVYLPPSYAGDQARRYPVVYLLHGYGGRDDTFNGRLANLPESADRLAAAQGFSELIVVTPNAFSLHKGQHVFELGHHGRLGELRRAGSRRLRRWPLPHDRQPHEPRPGRSLDGRIRRGSDRYEAAGCVLEPVHHERVLPDGEHQSAAGGDGACGGDQDARAGRGGGPRPRVRALRESRVGRRVVAESQ